MPPALRYALVPPVVIITAVIGLECLGPPADPRSSAAAARDSGSELTTAAVGFDPTSAGPATPRRLANGGRVYRSLCLACHMPDGRGVAGVTPPLASADTMLGDRERTVRIVLHGLSGPVTVNGVEYNGIMPPLDAVLTDGQAADVLTYVFNTWGNRGDAFDPGFVGDMRARKP